MKSVFKILQKNTLIFGHTHQLTSRSTDEYKAFSTFRVWEMRRTNARLKNKHHVL